MKALLVAFRDNRRYIIIILAMIIFLGGALRMVHFDDTLFFEIDQARDWHIVQTAAEDGAGELPLVGARAGGTGFRLGPVYHYFQYISGKIFGATPSAMAYPDLIFSLLAIIVFYYFSREYFVRTVALLITLLFATSLFHIEFARFGWNPNSLPFFMLATLYGLLRFSRAKTERHKMIWTAVIACGSAVAMQLHSVAFIGLPIVILSYLVLARVRVSLKHVGIFIIVGMLIFSPLIFNDVLTHGENTAGFFSAINSKLSANEDHGIDKKIFKNTHDFARSYTLILTSSELVQNLARTNSAKSGLDLARKNANKNALVAISAFLLFCGAFVLLFKKLRNEETAKEKKNFILIIFIVQIMAFILFLPVALKQDMRYFLVASFVPFVLLGVYADLLYRSAKDKNNILLYGLIAVLFASNLFFTLRWINGVNQYVYIESEDAVFSEYILEPYYYVTYPQIKNIAHYISQQSIDKDYIVTVDALPYYARPIKYELVYNDYGLKVSRDKSSTKDTKEQIYYYLVRERDKTKNRSLLPETYEKSFRIQSQKEFGTLIVLSLAPLEINDDGSTIDLLERRSIEDQKSCLDNHLPPQVKCRLRDIPLFFKQS